MDDIQQPVFIVSVQRSGSTLLRLMLNAHPQMAIPEEARFLCPVLKRYYLQHPLSGHVLKNFLRYLEQNPQYKLWNYNDSHFFAAVSDREEISLRELLVALYTSYATSEGKTLWGDKSLFFREIDVLAALFPQARFIHIVRDGRAVYDSWRKMDITKDNVAAAAVDWCYKIYRIERAFRRLPNTNILTIRYEDLINNPEKILRKVCCFLNIGYDPKMLYFYETSNYYVGKHHSDLIFKPVDNKNLYKWKRNISNLEADVFNFIAGMYLRKYDYEIESEGIRISVIFHVFRLLLLGIPKRLYQVMRVKWIFEKAVKEGRAVEHSTGEKPQWSKS